MKLKHLTLPYVGFLFVSLVVGLIVMMLVFHIHETPQQLEEQNGVIGTVHSRKILNVASNDTDMCPDGVTPKKSKLTCFLFSLLLGGFAVDRFYMGYIWQGVIKLLISVCTCGLCGGIWWLIDWILILTDQLPDASGCPLKLDM